MNLEGYFLSKPSLSSYWIDDSMNYDPFSILWVVDGIKDEFSDGSLIWVIFLWGDLLGDLGKGDLLEEFQIFYKNKINNIMSRQCTFT